MLYIYVIQTLGAVCKRRRAGWGKKNCAGDYLAAMHELVSRTTNFLGAAALDLLRIASVWSIGEITASAVQLSCSFQGWTRARHELPSLSKAFSIARKIESVIYMKRRAFNWPINRRSVLCNIYIRRVLCWTAKSIFKQLTRGYLCFIIRRSNSPQQLLYRRASKNNDRLLSRQEILSDIRKMSFESVCLRHMIGDISR